MTRRSLVLALLAPKGEWTSLFDGKTSGGWLEVTGGAFPSTTWRVEDGCLHSLKISEGGGFQDIRTQDEFTEFEFEFEWKIETGGNSGVKYLIDRVNRFAAKDGTAHARGRGAEYQIADDAANPDAAKDPKRHCGALYGKIAPAAETARRAGEFNQSKIVVAASRVEHWLNGTKVVEYESAAKRSPIVLQHHNSDTWFRNLRIRGM